MKRRRDEWFPLYVGDYLRDTSHLTTAQHGAYLLLLMACWTRGGYLPNDPANLARIVGVTTQKFTPIWYTLEGFFETVGDGRIFQRRMLLEVGKAKDISEKRAKAGAAGGRPTENQLVRTMKHPRGQDTNPSGLPETVSTVSFSPTDLSSGDDDGLLFGPEIVPAKDRVREAFESYNAVAADLGLPVARDLTEKRRKSLAARLKKSGAAGWEAALAEVRRSPFLTGQTHHNFRADLDFLLQDSKHQRVVEGYYANTGAANEQPRTDDKLSRRHANYERAFRAPAATNRNDW